MIAFDTAIRIEQPIDQVFAYVTDVGNLPHWNSAVQWVRGTSADRHASSVNAAGAGSRTRRPRAAW